MAGQPTDNQMTTDLNRADAMTLDTYADLFEDDLDAVAERLEAGALGANVAKLWPAAVSS
jgi:hypothetical protein